MTAGDGQRTPPWFWLLPALAAALWWPISPYFASDDFVAMHYARDAAAVAHDFVGPQYAAADVWAFYRPLITLSFWCDQAIGGAWPPTGHLSNVFAHAVSTLLIAFIWRRFLPNGQAFGAALLWAMMPGHVGSIAWVVGRVDSHTTVWCLLAVWLCLRSVESRGRRWPTALATIAALMSKELALVVPMLCTWIGWLAAEGGLLTRVRAAWRASWPAWLVLTVYLPFRLMILGRFGGYEASTFDPAAAAAGLGSITLDQLVPSRWIGGAETWTRTAIFGWAAAVPLAIAAIAAIARRPRLVAGAAVAWLIALAPMATFLSQADNPHNLRYQYLPSVVLAGVLASGHRWIAPAVILAWLWPLTAVRIEQHASDSASARIHAALLRAAPEAPTGPMFVGGMPHANDSGTALQLHFGVDRMLQPPFYPAGAQLFAWRPLDRGPDSIRLQGADGLPFTLSEGSTWWFADPSALGRAPTAPPMDELVITGDQDGAVDLRGPVLDDMLANFATILKPGGRGPSLVTPGVRTMGYRVTIFTANGYLCCWCPNHAASDATDGRLDFARFFGGDPQNPLWQRGATVTRTWDVDIGSRLDVPTTIDLDPTFPTLIEAGDFDAQNTFRPTHRARRMIRLNFDRSFPEWRRRCMGQ